MLGLTPRRFVFIAFLLAVVFLAKEYVPPLFSRFQFGDDIRQVVKYAAATQKDVDAVRRRILELAEEDGVEVTNNDIKITKRGPSFTVDVYYSWPIDMKVYQQELQFHISEHGEIFEK
jgi:hypothetical protein